MELLLATVCDDASVDDDGKLHVHGIFNELYAPGFPAKQEAMVLVAVLEWEREDAGRYAFRIDLVSPAGKPTLTVDGHTEVDPRPPDRPPARTRVVMPLEEVVFPEPGRYAIRIRAKGHDFSGPGLHLIEGEPPDPAAAPAGTGVGGGAPG